MINKEESGAKDWAAAPELQLWQTVIACTINEWLHGPLRKRREAEEYLLHDQKDFPEVCRSAGMDADYLRARLIKMCRLQPKLECLPPLAA